MNEQQLIQYYDAEIKGELSSVWIEDLAELFADTFGLADDELADISNEVVLTWVNALNKYVQIDNKFYSRESVLILVNELENVWREEA